MDTFMPNLIDAIAVEAVRRKYPGEVVRHVQVSRNFGRLGGWLRCEFLAVPSNDGSPGFTSTGQTASRVEYPHV